MKHTYDWSKLDAGWSYDSKTGRGGALRCHDGTTWIGSVTVDLLEETLNEKHDGFMSDAQDQLAKCRIPTPDVATVTELRPRDEYDWSRLEGSRWRHDPAIQGMHVVSNGEFEYWYDNGEQSKLTLANALVPFSADNALVAQQEAERLVEKCRRGPGDWRDEIAQACEGTGVIVKMHPEYATIGEFITAYRCRHRMSVWEPPGAFGIEHLLRMSLIIERLKKLGWREA